MMGIMLPETCWASNKICNKNHLLHLVGILFPQTSKVIPKSHRYLVSRLRNVGLKTPILILLETKYNWVFTVDSQKYLQRTCDHGNWMLHWWAFLRAAVPVIGEWKLVNMLSLWLESGSYSICRPCERKVGVTQYSVPVNGKWEILNMLSLWLESGSYSICRLCEWKVGVTQYSVLVNGKWEILSMLSLWLESGSYSICCPCDWRAGVINMLSLW